MRNYFFYPFLVFLFLISIQAIASEVSDGEPCFMDIDVDAPLSREASQQNVLQQVEEPGCLLVTKVGRHLYREPIDVYKELLLANDRVAVLSFEPEQAGKEFYFKTFYHHFLRREIKSIQAEINRDLAMPVQYHYIVWVQHLDPQIEGLMQETRPHNQFSLSVEPSGAFAQSLKTIPGCVNLTLYEKGVRKDIHTVNQGKMYPEF